jgi:uncharacterized protein YciI
MAITSSQILEDRAQVDGRRHVRERHTDHLTRQHDVTYMAAAGADVNATMTARVATIEAQLKQNEIDANLAKALNGETDTFTFQHSTGNENLIALRALFKSSTKWELVTLAHVLHHQNLTNNQLDTLFGTTNATERTAVRNKLSTNDTRYHDILAEQSV